MGLNPYILCNLTQLISIFVEYNNAFSDIDNLEMKLTIAGKYTYSGPKNSLYQDLHRP